MAAQVKVQQLVLLHQDMDIQVRLNKDIPVVPRGLDCFTVAVVAQGRKGRMEAHLLQERAEWGHLFPGHLLYMEQLVLDLADILVVAVVGEA